MYCAVVQAVCTCCACCVYAVHVVHDVRAACCMYVLYMYCTVACMVELGMQCNAIRLFDLHVVQLCTISCEWAIHGITNHMAWLYFPDLQLQLYDEQLGHWSLMSWSVVVIMTDSSTPPFIRSLAQWLQQWMDEWMRVPVEHRNQVIVWIMIRMWCCLLIYRTGDDHSMTIWSCVHIFQVFDYVHVHSMDSKVHGRMIEWMSNKYSTFLCALEASCRIHSQFLCSFLPASFCLCWPVYQKCYGACGGMVPI